MEFNRQRLDAMTKPRPAENIRRAKERAENREWMRMSHDIALGLQQASTPDKNHIEGIQL